MNFFNTLSSRLVGGLDTTSLNYINNLEVTTTLDMCGNDLIDLSNAVYGSKAYGINAYDANSSFLVVHNSSNNLPLKTSDFALNPFKGFSVYMKYKVRDNGLYTVFSQYAIDNPIVKLTSSHTEVEAGDTFQITVFQKGYADLSYAITGVTSAQLGGASLTGTVSDMYTVLPFTLQNIAELEGTLVFSAGESNITITTIGIEDILIKANTADEFEDAIGIDNTNTVKTNGEQYPGLEFYLKAYHFIGYGEWWTNDAVDEYLSFKSDRNGYCYVRYASVTRWNYGGCYVQLNGTEISNVSNSDSSYDHHKWNGSNDTRELSFPISVGDIVKFGESGDGTWRVYILHLSTDVLPTSNTNSVANYP